ncbi:protein BCCIP homolog [Culicoides brevitarsis]|uniref:protein BCCIP homolog n=1 Tax=Culicoides brevitarsis TaxID=469753 RepID=UPI00307C26F6
MSSKKKKIDSLNNENEEINVNFEGSTATSQDADGIKQLLLQLFLKAHINLTELADIIIGQNYIGSVIKQCYDDDEDLSEDEDPNLIFGITTIVSLENNLTLSCLEQITGFLLEKAENNSDDHILNIFKGALEGQKAGLLINERFVNIPAQISLPLFESLDAEMNQAISKNKPFDFSSLILISKFYRKVDGNGKLVEDILSNLEEECFAPFIIASFDYSVEKEADSGNWEEEDLKLIPFRKVSLIDAKKLSDMTKSLKNFLK